MVRKSAVQKLKDELKKCYDDRPIYNGKEYNVLHKWYCRLAELL